MRKVGLMGAVVLGVVAAAALAQSPESSTIDDAVKAKVREAASYTFDEQFQSVLTDLKGRGSAEQIQKSIGRLYSEGNVQDRLTMLRLLDRLGVEHALAALPAIARDFAEARPKHPNDMSFAGFYVLEKFMNLAWRKIPSGSEAEKEARTQTQAPEDRPNRVATDGSVTTGSSADRTSIRNYLLDHKLNVIEKSHQTFPVPDAADTTWFRAVGDHGFVRLRGRSSGVDYLFLRANDGRWRMQAELGQWVN